MMMADDFETALGNLSPTARAFVELNKELGVDDAE